MSCGGRNRAASDARTPLLRAFRGSARMTRFPTQRDAPANESMGEFMKRWHFWGGARCSAFIVSSVCLPSFADEPPVTTLKARQAGEAEAPEGPNKGSLVRCFRP